MSLIISPLIDAKTLEGKSASAFALASHGTHIPTPQTADNKTFLRNDNTWQVITPANIGAMSTGHAANSITGFGGDGGATTVSRSDHSHSNYITSSGSITGNAGSATKLQTARTINGVSFDGTANITITATPTAHTHTKSQITDMPTSLPANGGNSDTVDNAHVNDTGTDTASLWTANKIISYVSNMGGGDMTKSVYDKNNDGIVDVASNSDTLQGYNPDMGPTAETIVLRDWDGSVSGYNIMADSEVSTPDLYIGIGATNTTAASYYYDNGTGYVYKKSLANARAEIVTSTAVTTALGFTPYNSTNPNGYITSSASITGNAATATKLQNARTINGVSFDGTANITIADSTKLPLSGGDVTGATKIAGVKIGGDRLDASLHISSALGGLGRLTQLCPSTASTNAMNIIASKNASSVDQWWSWGVGTDNKFYISPGPDSFNTNGLIVSSASTLVKYLEVAAQDASSKGGEIKLLGAGSKGAIHLDNYDGSFRIHNGTVTGIEVKPDNQINLKVKTNVQADMGFNAGLSLYFGREESFGGTDVGGGDYGFITFNNDDNSYNWWGDSAENSSFIIGTQNDALTSNSDVLVLKPANGNGAVVNHAAVVKNLGDVDVDGKIKVGNKFSIQYNSTENSLDFVFIG